MRINTKKLLVWIYPTSDKNKLFDSKIARRVCGGLSDSGWRSMLFLLENKGLIQIGREAGRTWLSLTNKGKRLIEAEIEVLSPIWGQWQGGWSVLIMEKEGKGGGKEEKRRAGKKKDGAEKMKVDKKEKMMKDLYGFEWQKGFYLIPDFQALIVSEKILKSDMDNVWLLKISDWIVGDWREKIAGELNYDFYKSFYSGVSREVDSLLRKRNHKKTLIESEIIKLLNIFDRLFFTGKNERGLNILLTWDLGDPEKRTSDYVRILEMIQNSLNG